MTTEAGSHTVSDSTTAFLSDHVDGEQALEAVLSVDSTASTWTFDDIPLDSGTFGELVSRGIVEKADGEYRVVEPAQVQAVLDGDSVETTTADDTTRSVSLPSVDGRTLAGLVIALVVVAGARMTTIGSVFQQGYRISPANDPYYFRYWMGQLVTASEGRADYSVLVDAPSGVMGTRPLTHATNWALASLLGANQWAIEMVAIWAPVVGSVALGVLIYALAVLLTRDVRVGIASVLVFAVTPVHAVYTGIGFIDHNVYQYFWLGVTLLSLGWLAVDLQRRIASNPNSDSAVKSQLTTPLTWVVAVGFGVSVAFGTHAWGGSPLLLIPLAAYLGFKIAMDVREGIDPLGGNLPALGGLALGSLLALRLHLRWDWHSGFVAMTPLLVLCGTAAVVGLGILWRRYSLDVRGLLAVEASVVAIGLFVFQRLRPDDWAAARERIDNLFSRDYATETLSLFSTEHFVIFGPLYQLGMEFYIALAVLGWIGLAVKTRYEPGWLLVGTYSAYLLVLAGIQVRFAGQLAIPFSILGGLGIVYVLSAIDLARPLGLFDSETSSRPRRNTDDSVTSFSLPNRSQALYLVGIGVLVFGLSLIYVPGLAAQTTYSPAQVDALTAIDEHASTVDREYPENFVFNEWGENRMYNHFISGESQGYGYAQSNYVDFQTGSDPDGWYDEFDGRVGYVVVTSVSADAPPESTYVQLLEELGAGSETTEPLSHYQLLSVDPDHSAAAFAVVPGATLTASAPPGETVTVETTVEVDETSFSYEREVTVDDEGRLSVTVPYAGSYRVGDDHVEVSERDVLDGETVEVDFDGN